MLVLSRKPKQRIIIRDRVTKETIVKIDQVRCDHHNSRLGFTAPDRYEIVREELIQQDSLAEMPSGG